MNIVYYGQNALISGTRRRGDVVLGVDITPMFTFGSIHDAGFNEEQMERALEMCATRQNGWEEFYATKDSTAIYGAGYDAQRAADKAKHDAALRLSVGDVVEYHGVQLRIDVAPNDNVYLVRI